MYFLYKSSSLIGKNFVEVNIQIFCYVKLLLKIISLITLSEREIIFGKHVNRYKGAKDAGLGNTRM